MDKTGKIRSLRGYAPRTASLKAFAARKRTPVLALILMGSPVWGLRPMRALRWALTARPRFGITNLPAPPLHSFTANLKSSSKNALTVFLGVSHFSARWPTTLDLLIGFAISFLSPPLTFLVFEPSWRPESGPHTRDTIKRVPAQRKRKCKKAAKTRWLAISMRKVFSF